MSKVDRALARGREIAANIAKLVAAGAGAEHLSEYRRRVTRDDPMAFALVYLSRHLVDQESGKVTLSTIHVEWAESAKSWMHQPSGPTEDRRAEVAPRNSGKSTWWFTILPAWGAAHDHIGFAAAFADTEAQAQTHLATFKSELDNNPLIRADYPDLVAPKTRGRGQVAADRVSLYHATSGFVFAAAGMDSANLGMKVGDRRPDLIILDDIEPQEGKYSEPLAKKRLTTLRDAILPLNIYAHVMMVGTVTMVDSIVHQVVKRSNGTYDASDPKDITRWVAEEKITARHWYPLRMKKNGKRVSLWPEKWPTKWLLEREPTREFAKNYANDPLGADGDYWTIDDFSPLTPETDAEVTHEVIEVDPAVTTNASSDFTGIAAVGWARALNKCAVYEARQIKASPDDIRLAVLKAVERALARGHLVIVRIEGNQGGDLWKRILWGLPVKVIVHPAGTASKNVRAADALDHYQRGRVEHAPGLRDAEGQMAAFPNAPHDDLVDAVGAGVRYFLSRDKKKKPKAGAVSVRY